MPESIAKEIYEGTYHGERSARGRKVFVLGAQFGPMLYCIGADCEEALNEFDERHGRRVGTYADDIDLRDYGPDAESAIENAMNDGDVRINDGGTVVWVDHYEFMHEFANLKEAYRAFQRR